MNAYQPAEAAVQDAEPPLVVGDLHKALYVAVVVGTHHPVGLRVDLVDAARRHLQTHGLPHVTPVVLVAVVTLREFETLRFVLAKRTMKPIFTVFGASPYLPCRLSFPLRTLF